jgi:hypothetical protein
MKLSAFAMKVAVSDAESDKIRFILLPTAAMGKTEAITVLSSVARAMSRKPASHWDFAPLFASLVRTSIAATVRFVWAVNNESMRFSRVGASRRPFRFVAKW